MRSLDNIFSSFLYAAKREVIFEDGEWCIYRRQDSRDYIVHRCDKVNTAHNPHINTCVCGAVMPVELKGLVLLSEWER